MNSKKPSRRIHRDLCADVGPDDGIDPRDWQRPEGRRRPGRKLMQLCNQVAETLNVVLAGECGDDVLRDLAVLSVVPAAGSSRLLVTLGFGSLPGSADHAQLLQRLEKARGLLRTEVAAAINRRRAPDLVFRLRVPVH